MVVYSWHFPTNCKEVMQIPSCPQGGEDRKGKTSFLQWSHSRPVFIKGLTDLIEQLGRPRDVTAEVQSSQLVLVPGTNLEDLKDPACAQGRVFLPQGQNHCCL